MRHAPGSLPGGDPRRADDAAWAATLFDAIPSTARFYITVGAVGAAVFAAALVLARSAPTYWPIIVVTGPLYLAYRTHKLSVARMEVNRRHFEELAELHLSTVEALALAIDAKDQTATAHIRRVQRYAAAVAHALGMTPQEVQGVRTAALLHDIGKLAVPEHILSKPGPLTAEEFQKIQIHPVIGAEIIAGVPFPYPVAPLILSHHERWDGKGYPHGLQGEQIPLGARILTVVDYFDALTCDRPYHTAVSDAEAVAAIGAEAGTALDPNVVAVFVGMLPQLRADAARKTGDPPGSSRLPASPAATHLFRTARPAGRRRCSRNRARAPRDLRALRHRAIHGHGPRRVGHDGAHRVEAAQRGTVRILRPVLL